MKILNKELRNNLNQVCNLFQINAINANKSKEFICTVAVHCDFFVVNIMEFLNFEVKSIDTIYFTDSNSIEKNKELINKIKATLGL